VRYPKGGMKEREERTRGEADRRKRGVDKSSDRDMWSEDKRSVTEGYKSPQ
jgi:hypothetical protein